MSDTFLSPITLSDLTGSSTNNGYIYSSNASDFYKISLNNPSVINMTLNGSHLNTNSSKYGDIQIFVYNSTDSSTIIASNIVRTTAKTLSVPLASGDYVIKLQRSNTLTNEDYSFILQSNAMIDEAGNSIVSANTSLLGSNLLGQTINVTGKIAGYNQVTGLIDPADYYAFTLSTSANITVVNNTPSIPYSIVNSNNITVSPTKLLAGTYYFVLTGSTTLSNKLSPNPVSYNLNITATEVLSPSLTYNKTSLTEATINDGSISDFITATLSNGTFLGTNGTLLPITGTNVPAGLNLVASKLTDTTAKIYFTGKATLNNFINSINNLEFSFGNSAFTSGNSGEISNSSKTGISLNFTDNIAGSLTYSSTEIIESITNNGALNPVTVTLSGETFSDSISITSNNLPAGITGITASKIDSTHATLSFTGNATLHQASNSTTNFSLSFTNESFTNGDASKITNNTKTFPINFTNNTRSLAFDKTTLSEVSANNGAIDSFITVTLSGDLFSGSNDSTLSITVSNLPSGLNATATKLSDTTAKIAFSGNATNHAPTNSISDLKLVFNDDAFNQKNANLVTNNSTTQNFGLIFADPAQTNYTGSLSYSVSGFNETSLNYGQVGAITLTLTGDTFANNLTILPYTFTGFSNTAIGFTGLIFAKTSPTTATATLSGRAILHQAGHSLPNFTISLDNSAFTGGNASVIQNSTKNLPITFTNNPRELVFSTTTLNESSANDGSITETFTVNIKEGGANPKGDWFLPDSTGYIPLTTENLPAGLTISAIRPSSNSAQAIISITGNALAHEALNSVSNFKIRFLDSAFKQGFGNLVTNNGTQNIALNFKDAVPVTLNPYTATNNLPVATDIVLNFSDNIVANSSGEIIITDGTNRTVVPITDTKQIKIEGSQLTINPTSDLVANKNYHVEIAPNVILGFAGISDPNTVQFTTGNLIYTQGTKGNSNSTGSGTITSPYQSIGYATTKALTGDTIYVLDNPNVISTNYTLAGSGYTIKPAPNNTGKYQFSSMTAFTVTGTNITIENFEFTGNSNALNYWDLLANYVWTPANLPAVGSIALNVSTGQDITIRDNYFHDLQQKAVNIESGRYVTVSSNIIRDVATTSLSGGHAIMRQQGTGVFGTADYTSKYRWDINNNIIYNVEQRIYSWVPSKGYLNMTLDEGKPINIDETTDLDMKARISNNVILNPAIDAIRIKPTPNLEISNNSIYSNKPEADGITDINTLKTLDPYSTNPFPNLVVKNNAVQVVSGKYAFELNDAFSTDTNNFTNNLANGLTNPDALTGRTDTINDLFANPANGNFTLNQGFSNTIGASPTALKNIAKSLINRNISVVADSWTPDHLKMTQTLLDNIPDSVFTDTGTYGLSDKESTTGRYSYYFTVNPTWKSANGVNNNVLSHSGAFANYDGKYEIITPTDYSDWYNYYKSFVGNYSSIRWGSSYIAQNKTFDANSIFFAEMKDDGSFTQTTGTSGKTITLDGDILLNLDYYHLAGTHSYDLLTASNIIGTFDNLKTIGLQNNISYKLSYSNSKINVIIADNNAILAGTDSADILVGNRIDGKLGNDTLSGGDTNNIFVFSTTPSDLNNIDTITNFKTTDRIDLSLSTFSNLGGNAGSLLTSNQYSDSTAETADTRIYADRSVSGQVSLYYDSDGNGSAVAIKFAILSNFSSALTASNFGMIA